MAALRLSAGGQRGLKGGSVTLSHAYANNPGFVKAYRSRFGSTLLKTDIRSLVWKESMLIALTLRKQNVKVLELANQCPMLRFIYPVRNPIDCAISNLNQGGMAELICQLRGEMVTLENVIKNIIEYIAWFAEMASKKPDQFQFVLQNSLQGLTALPMQDFLQVDHDKRWQAESQALLSVKPSYSVNNDIREFTRCCIKSQLSQFPLLENAVTQLVS